MKIFNLLQTKYYEFDQAIKAYLSKTLSNFEASYGNNTIFGQLINVLGGVVQNIMLYIEDALTEQNKHTAQRKKSIYGLAVQSGYIPSLGKAATCNIRLSFIPNNNQGVNIVIPNKTQFMCSQNGLIYNLVLPQENVVLSVERDNSYKYFQIVEGRYESQTFYSTGGQLYTRNISFDGDVDIDFLTVKVNDELWSRADSLYDMESNGMQYVCRPSLTKGFDLIFGNEQYGRALVDGDKIDVEYLVHSGELGNIDTNEEINFAFIDQIQSVGGEELNANEVFAISLVDTDGVNSGTYGETVQQVKEMIGYNSRALVLASPQNYKTFINRFSFCGYSRTWSEPGSLIVNSIIMRNYKMHLTRGSDYFNLSPGDFFLTDAQKDSIQNCIANSGHQLAGVTHKIFEPELVKYACYVYIKTKNTNYDKTSIENEIRDIVGDFMSNIENDMYIPKSDLIQAIKSQIDDIDGINIYFVSERNEEAIIAKQYVNKIYQYNSATGKYDISKETVYVPEETDPCLGLDSHGNILLDNSDQFPVLMGGWRYRTDKTAVGEDQLVTITNPLIIVFE